MEDFQALVSQGDINSPVSGVALTAIGYVGEKLHIQIRYDSALETDNHGYVYLKNSDGDVLDCEASISFFTENCFPVKKKSSARMRTAAYKVDVASDRRRRENVPRHILCSRTQRICMEKRLYA